MTRIATAAAITALTIGLTSGAALAGDPNGLWKTEANDAGEYLVVKIGACGSKVCGEIVDARNGQGESNPEYEHIGRDIISGMEPDGDNKWGEGEIWAPDEDKTYSSNLELKGDVLVVEGCVLVFCRGQDWTRAN